MTAPTDAPVEERHRRAAVQFLDARGYYGNGKERWCATGCPADNGYAYPYEGQLATVLANAERDGRASRDAEVAELSAYRRAWDTVLARCAFGIVEADEDETVDLAQTLAEELARKGTP